MLAGDGLVPFSVLTELDALPDDGFAFHDLHDHNLHKHTFMGLQYWTSCKGSKQSR